MTDCVRRELDVFASTESLNGQNSLEVFYTIYKSHKDNPPGSENKINSWTAYALGMTTKKPAADEEFFPVRRVYARATYPDVDIDFDPEYQDQVQQYLIDTYGRDNVANIGTYQKFEIKDTVRRLSKALDCAYAFHKGKDTCRTENAALANEITGSLPNPRSGALWGNVDGKDKKLESVREAADLITDFGQYLKKYPKILDHADNIGGLVRGFGVHAAGIVISSEPLSGLAPLRTSKKGLATVFPYEELELIGLIKFDILAIATLTVIRKTLELVKQNYGIDINLAQIPLDDATTLELYRKGYLAGVFQCEQYGMQKTMKDIAPESFDDIMATVALYRPGPMDAIPDFVARKRGEKQINYFHPSIEKYVKPILERTYGIPVYQEQIMKVVQSLAGFSPTQGYVMIKAVGKKKPHLMVPYKTKFIDGCVERDVPADVAEQYWDKFIVPFSGYGFNSAHCLGGNMRVKNKLTGELHDIEELANIWEQAHDGWVEECEAALGNPDCGSMDMNVPKIVLDSYLEGSLVEDELIDVFSTGEQDVYEIQLTNGMKIECSLKHKFLCSDEQVRTLEEIIEGDFEILYEVTPELKEAAFLPCRGFLPHIS